jgi:hypothetical protein
MSERPSPGDEVKMAMMGDDVHIEVADVIGVQPLAETDGVFIIIDQYGDEHLVEMDGDSWVTTNCNALSPEGVTLWLGYCEAKVRITREKFGFRTQIP